MGKTKVFFCPKDFTFKIPSSFMGNLLHISPYFLKIWHLFKGIFYNITFKNWQSLARDLSVVNGIP